MIYVLVIAYRRAFGWACLPEDPSEPFDLVDALDGAFERARRYTPAAERKSQ